ncbi:MAG: type secretion system secreted protein VgrG [Blastocatellia bacterium]|nr:type secretion system secreted protein VgrG [Blastocatellia bacterium]
MPPLGAAQSFAALGGTAITATGSAVISGNVGVSPGSAVTGFPPAVVQNGQIYTGAASLAGDAQNSALIAYNNLKGQTCNSANNLSGKILGQTPGFLTLGPGVYCFDTSAQLNATLTLNDGGDPNAIFIFQIGTTLTTASSSQVIMSSGGRGTNVYWQIGSSATIGTSTVFRGHIIANTSITLTTSASTTGRVFALNGAATIDSTAVDAVPTGIQFNAANFNMNEGCGGATITVMRTGDTSGVATVDYATTDGSGLQRTDYTLAFGTIVFAAGETSKTFFVLGTKDSYNTEGIETVNLTLSNPTGASVGSQGTATVSIADDTTVPANSQPIDDAGTFVCQHYHDFLNRQADANGQSFWTNEIASCVNDANCRQEKRINVSAAFFLSVEFQNTGYFAFRFYRGSFADSAQRPRGLPRYLEFLRDEQALQNLVVVGQTNWEAVLEQNKQGFALNWVDRADFIAEYPTTMVRDDYIDKLFLRSGATPTTQERNQAQFAYDSGGSVKEKRAKGIRAVVDTGAVYNAEYNPAFVLMQYFGYLRRNPDSAPDNNFGGYDFWLNKMNQFSLAGEDVRDAQTALNRMKRAEMVKAFLVAGEYRGRFGVN